MRLTALMQKEGISFVKKIQMSSFLFSRGGINYVFFSSFVIITLNTVLGKDSNTHIDGQLRHVN